MWLYEKRLQYPVNVRKPDAKTAKIVISQLGGPNGELGAALRYLNQRYTMPYPRIQALLYPFLSTYQWSNTSRN